MRRKRRMRSRFTDDENINPMEYASNMSDVMLCLALGIMLALIINWNVDITASPGEALQTDSASQSLGEFVDPEQADAAFSEEDMDAMREEITDDPGGMEERGKLYYDPETGTYYIVEGGSD